MNVVCLILGVASGILCVAPSQSELTQIPHTLTLVIFIWFLPSRSVADRTTACMIHLSDHDELERLSLWRYPAFFMGSMKNFAS